MHASFLCCKGEEKNGSIQNTLLYISDPTISYP